MNCLKNIFIKNNLKIDKNYLIGQGFDIHLLKESNNKYVILAGYKIKCNYMVIAHSDGDVVYHCAANAILGAIQKGDIGEYFKDTNFKNKGLDSYKIIEFAINQMKKNQKIVNIDLTIVCDKIMLTKYKKQIKKQLVNITNCNKINIKATRFEDDRLAIACICNLLITQQLY